MEQLKELSSLNKYFNMLYLTIISLPSSAPSRAGSTHSRTPMYGSQTPLYGSQTPGSRTPMYGSQTPTHDGMLDNFFYVEHLRRKAMIYHNCKSLWRTDETTCIKPACSSQLAASLLTTCNRRVIIKPEQAMGTYPDIWLGDSRLAATCAFLAV